MDEEPPIINNNNNNDGNSRAVSIRALRRETKNVISTLLNPKKIIHTERGLPRYWLGLAELCGIGGEEISNLRESKDPALAVLNVWYRKAPDESTISNLLKHLETLDRYDVIDDVNVLITEDVVHFNKHPEIKEQNPPFIDDIDALIPGDMERKLRGEDFKMFDAFVLFADEDVDFASVLKQTMQNDPYNLELCTKEDLLAGCIEIDAVIKCISERCRRLIVILSPDFFRSNANYYYTKFAQVEGIEKRKRKIIPCVCRPCSSLPPEFRLYFLLDYERCKKLGLTVTDFWNQLYHSVLSTSITQSLSENSSVVKKSMETLKIEQKPINHVKFNSMVNLKAEQEERTSIIKENVSPCSSDTSLEPLHHDNVLKKKNSFYKKLKNFVHLKNAGDNLKKLEQNNEVGSKLNGHVASRDDGKSKKKTKVLGSLQKKFMKVKVAAN